MTQTEQSVDRDYYGQQITQHTHGFATQALGALVADWRKHYSVTDKQIALALMAVSKNYIDSAARALVELTEQAQGVDPAQYSGEEQERLDAPSSTTPGQ